MTSREDQILESACRLHGYIANTHWNGQALVGPDPGIRINYRIGRFVKGYLRSISWHDDLYYVQGQGYWVLANWKLFDRTKNARYRELAVQASEHLLTRQREDGAWDYPNPEWKGRVATAEGTWGSLGLLESYRQTGDQEFLQGASRWHDFLVNTTGFELVGDELSVNYFANLGTGRVPNNSAFVLRFLADLADVTQDAFYLDRCPGLLMFIRNVQFESGELPYVAKGPGSPERKHFQCFQYNAFECLDLMTYFRLSGLKVLSPVVTNLLDFLRGGLAPAGFAFYQCGIRYRTVHYHTAVLAAAFREAELHGATEFGPLAKRAWDHVLQSQTPDGGFAYSSGDYRILSDRRSYPRYLSMILLHLLMHDHSIQRQWADTEDAPVQIQS